MSGCQNLLTFEDDIDEEEDDDVSNESIAEQKILKIDRRLNRLRKSHLIVTLQVELSRV